MNGPVSLGAGADSAREPAPSRLGRGIRDRDGVSRRAAVLGHPIAHSLSPTLHRAAYSALGLDWQYTAHDVDSPDLAAFVASCGPEWAGLSLTMPLKQTVIELLDHVEPLAELVGAVNTLLFQHGSGGAVLVGANTDVYGVVAALREGLAARDSVPDGGPGRAVVLGGGATAASALAALGELGYAAPAVFVRSLARTGSVRRAAHRMGLEPTFHTLDHAPAALADADLVVSTIPSAIERPAVEPGSPSDPAVEPASSASAGRDPLAPVVDHLRAPLHGVLLDVVYEPRPTSLGVAWAAAGGTYVSGERMLLHQAVEQVRLMTGRPAPVEAMSAALEERLGQ